MNEGEIYLRFLAKQPIKLLAIQIINCSELIFKTISWIQVRTVIRSLLSPNFKGQELTLWLFSVETWHPRIPEVLVRTTRSLPGCGLARFLTNLCPRSHAVAPFIFPRPAALTVSSHSVGSYIFIWNCYWPPYVLCSPSHELGLYFLIDIA